MASVPAPVTVVTTAVDGIPSGATVSSFASLSLDPPLVSIGLIEGSRLLRDIRRSRRLMINLLSHDQENAALQFASRAEDRFLGIGWTWESGLPKLDGVASYAECVVESDLPAGDHAMIFCKVLECRLTDTPPLIYGARKFGTHSHFMPA
ncbi:flavin reductase family protein [Novosphingobium naphthalenivorans]|jgi:flavin reductase (DIM6/NTAB) family NADH-FMN oxidoreductase RutF|nr:flavin reductase family protein [Novosphingobium naphthalenivorans]